MSVWAERRVRALELASAKPHAADILDCYAKVTEVQALLSSRIPVSEWVAATAASDSDGPTLRLEQLPRGAALELFDEFLDEMSGIGTTVMTAEALRLASSDRSERSELLGTTLLSDATSAQDFHARAFVEVVATTLAARVLPTTSAGTKENPGLCRTCGAPPIVATLRDLPDALGSRGLICSRCGCEARARRLTCAYCGREGTEGQRIHSPEGLPHIRIDECATCRSYIKTVDLRQRGDAVPIVDEIATVELDLWAKDQGLTKGRTNLFGL